MTLRQVSYAVKIAETGSMNKASEELFVSQPTLTSAIGELEREIGIVIFRRTNKGVSLTPEGMEFITHARQLYQHYELFAQKYNGNDTVKRHFGVSTQHYSFAVKAFVETVKKYDTRLYEFAIRETKTLDVINDVANLKSDIGILYMNDFNRKIIEKLLRDSDEVFHRLINCNAYVYVWKGHPLAQRKSVSFKELADYPCLSFEQGEKGSFYLAEEILSTNDYPRIIKATDRATMLNLMVGLMGYTLCSGIICEELNGNDFAAIPYEADPENPGSTMEIGYIVKNNSVPGDIGEAYITELKKYLKK